MPTDVFEAGTTPTSKALLGPPGRKRTIRDHFLAPGKGVASKQASQPSRASAKRHPCMRLLRRRWLGHQTRTCRRLVRICYRSLRSHIIAAKATEIEHQPPIQHFSAYTIGCGLPNHGMVFVMSWSWKSHPSLTSSG